MLVMCFKCTMKVLDQNWTLNGVILMIYGHVGNWPNDHDDKPQTMKAMGFILFNTPKVKLA